MCIPAVFSRKLSIVSTSYNNSRQIDAYCTTIVLAINRRSNYYKTTIMYTRIGILGRARQAIGIARLHALREALYIDVKYNSQLATRRSATKIANCDLFCRDSLTHAGP